MNNKHKWFRGRTFSNIIVICVGVLLYLALSNFASVRTALQGILSVFSPFVTGIGIAYLLNLPMRFFEKHLFKRFARKRSWAILLTYVVAIFLVALLLGLVGPQLVESIRTLLMNMNVYLDNLNGMITDVGHLLGIDQESLNSFLLNYNNLVSQLMLLLRDLLPNILGIAGQIGSGVVTGLTAIIASIYMLAGRDKLLVQCRRVLYALAPRRFADATMRVGRISNGIFSGFISGKILDSVIIGFICFVFMSIMNILYMIFGIAGLQMPYSVLISVVVGVTNFIPFFGPFIGAIPSILILLMAGTPFSAIWFTIFIIALQQFDGNVLGPKILGNSTGLPAMWVLVGIIVGGGLFGFGGMLLGVPVTAVLYNLASDFIEKRLKRRQLADMEGLATPEPPPGAPPDAKDNANPPQP